MFNWFKKAAPAANGVTGPQPTAAAQGETLRAEGNTFLDQGNLGAAAQSYRRWAALDPESISARINFAYALIEQGLAAEARQALHEALVIDPHDADALYMMAGVSQADGHVGEAINLYERAIHARPNLDVAYRDACRSCLESGDPARAISLLRYGLQLRPRSADLHLLLGNILLRERSIEPAVESYTQALSLEPDRAEAHANIAHALRAAGRLDAALVHMQRLVELQPFNTEAQVDCGVVLQSLGRVDEAVDRYRRVVAAEPRNVRALTSLGTALSALGHHRDALDHYRRAVTIDSTCAAGHAGVAVELHGQGCTAEALESFRRAVQAGPDHIEAHSSMLFLLSFVEDAQSYLDEARRYGAKVTARAHALGPPLAALSALELPLRIGMVSGDLRDHPVASFLEGVLRNLDPRRVSVFVYVTHALEDDVTVRLRSCCTAWVSIVGMDDDAAARRIHADGLHALIDLAGHTAHNRLSLLASRLAPVQVSWLGYFASTGVPGVDFVLTDVASVPEASQAHFSERVWYLPQTRLCFTPPTESEGLTPAALPAAQNGHVTFGCFQSLSKVNDDVLAAWSRVLAAVPSSRLRVQAGQLGRPEGREALSARMSRAGIAVERVSLMPGAPKSQYLAAYSEVDVLLDTFPYPGGTTTCEALWMGVPTLTLEGSTMLSRQGASMLRSVGLDNWVATDIDDYVERAARLTADLKGLARLRAGLREQVRPSALFDAGRFARAFESAFESMWADAVGRAAHVRE
jgi:protein O-GlcNAc transferase